MEVKQFFFFNLLLFFISFYFIISNVRSKLLYFLNKIFIIFSIFNFLFLLLTYNFYIDLEIIYFKFDFIDLKIRLDFVSFFFLFLNSILFLLLYLFVKFDRYDSKLNGLLLMLFSINNLFFLSGECISLIIFFEAMLIPATLMLWYYSGVNSTRNAFEFLLYNFGFSIFLIIGVILLYKIKGSFDFYLINSNISWLIFILVYIGIMVKTPVFPLHGWLINTYYNLPTYLTSIFSGILSKYGIFLFLRFFIDDFTINKFLILITTISAIYAGFMAWYQDDIKKIFTYMSMSHLNIILAGSLATLSYQIPSYLLVPFSIFHGILIFAFFNIVYFLENNTKILDINKYGNLTIKVPYFTTYFTFFLLVLAGFPLFGYFYLEFIILINTFKLSLPLGFLLSISIAINLIYKCQLFYKLIFKKPGSPETLSIKDINLGYKMLFFIISSMIIILTLNLNSFMILLETQGG